MNGVATRLIFPANGAGERKNFSRESDRFLLAPLIFLLLADGGDRFLVFALLYVLI